MTVFVNIIVTLILRCLSDAGISIEFSARVSGVDRRIAGVSEAVAFRRASQATLHAFVDFREQRGLLEHDHEDDCCGDLDAVQKYQHTDQRATGAVKRCVQEIACLG